MELYKKTNAHIAYDMTCLSNINYFTLLYTHYFDMYSIYNNTDYCVNRKFYVNYHKKGKR